MRLKANKKHNKYRYDFRIKLQKYFLKSSHYRDIINVSSIIHHHHHHLEERKKNGKKT